MALTNSSALFDALIIGAGPAGLSFATSLARQLHTAVVFDSGVYRNSRSQHMHNVVGWDHRNPAEFRSAGRNDLLKRYPSIQFQDIEIKTVRRTPSEKTLFEAVDLSGKTWYGRKLVLAPGVRDIPLDIEGYDECWGTGIFHCLFCDGYEVRGQETVGFLAIGAMVPIQRVLMQHKMALQLAETVTIYTGGDEKLAGELLAAISDPRVTVNGKTITRLEKLPTTTKVRVYCENEEPKEEGFLFHHAGTEVNGPFVEQLALKTTPMNDIEVTQPFNETSMPGVFAIGDCAGPVKAVTPAISSGTIAAAGVVVQLQSEPAPSLDL